MFGFRATLENLRDWKPWCQCQSSEQEGSSSHLLHQLWRAASPLVSLPGRQRSWSGCWGEVSNVKLLLSLSSALTEEPWGQCSPHPGCQTNLRPITPELSQSTVLLQVWLCLETRGPSYLVVFILKAIPGITWVLCLVKQASPQASFQAVLPRCWQWGCLLPHRPFFVHF